MGGVSSLGALLNRLHLEHYAAPFEDEAIEDVALLKSMGRQGLYDNLCGEMGLDAAGVATLSSALFDEADASEDELTLEPNDDDDDEHELLLEENEPQPPRRGKRGSKKSAEIALHSGTKRSKLKLHKKAKLSPGRSEEESSQALQSILAMGFNKAMALDALKETNYVLQDAVNWLMANCVGA